MARVVLTCLGKFDTVYKLGKTYSLKHVTIEMLISLFSTSLFLLFALWCQACRHGFIFLCVVLLWTMANVIQFVDNFEWNYIFNLYYMNYLQNHINLLWFEIFQFLRKRKWLIVTLMLWLFRNFNWFQLNIIPKENYSFIKKSKILWLSATEKVFYFYLNK